MIQMNEIDKIEKEELILPVVQRDFVWQSEKIELLFDTLLKKLINGETVGYTDERINRSNLRIKA